ncbi:hypothetical protein Tco_0195750 [Tanacetum coccineum]
MASWLFVMSTLLIFIQRSLSYGPPEPQRPTSIFGRMTQMRFSSRLQVVLADANPRVGFRVIGNLFLKCSPLLGFLSWLTRGEGIASDDSKEYDEPVSKKRKTVDHNGGFRGCLNGAEIGVIAC